MSANRTASGRLPKLIGLATVLAAAAAAYVLFGGGAIDPESQRATGNTASIEKGRQVYAENCASCHGVNLEGQPNWRTRNANGRLPAPPHDASGHTWHHDDQTLFELTKYGLSALVGRPIETDMPAYDGKLTDDEIWAALAFIRSRWPKKIQERQAALTPN
ncbi:MAG: cytochrome c [Proteobacteria bacterium]|nr:cytochrome c [Pseudomonadota bacterium]